MKITCWGKNFYHGGWEEKEEEELHSSVTDAYLTANASKCRIKWNFLNFRFFGKFWIF